MPEAPAVSWRWRQGEGQARCGSLRPGQHPFSSTERPLKHTGGLSSCSLRPYSLFQESLV